jgi:hypothetical protein
MTPNTRNTKRLLAKHIEQGSNIQAFSILAVLYLLRAYRWFSALPSRGRAFRFSVPTHERTPLLLAKVLAGMTIVLTTALSSIQTHPALLLIIPAYALYVSLVLVVRQQRLNAMA